MRGKDKNTVDPMSLRQVNQPTKFLVDGMLGSLAIKLRILGFDADYDKVSDDNALLKKSLESSRVLVTSDRELYRQSILKGVKAIVIIGSSDRDAILEIFHKCGMTRIDLSKPSRCSSCNGPLELAVHADEWGRPVSRCLKCGRSFWRGSHWKELDKLISNVEHALAREQKL